MGIKTDITLYTEGTPNGLKTSIVLEELGLEYKAVSMDLSKHEQKEAWFLEINPNGRIPALTDKDENGTEIKIFESGSILQYIVAKYDKNYKISYPYGTKEHWETVNWLMWQMGGIGPMQGQANHFTRFAPEKLKYPIDRYVSETHRLYRTLDGHLAKSKTGYIVGDRVTVADIAVWPWVAAHNFSGVPSITQYPHIVKWFENLLKRPGFEAGRNVPRPHFHITLNSLSEKELDKIAEGGRKWQDEAREREAALARGMPEV
ncbi:glutathione S-transferase [Periconia macrospinosa]|uniref:Glutathione S-transferase n=1 Tax=Periconia macrospinosa TaxID=97972 RepID=A0A2V1E6M8_9PLEO|nr:glutathione S-transferase [Periconia macrospinosa]